MHRAQVLGGSHAEIFDTAILKSERAELQLEADFERALERGEFGFVLPAYRVAEIEPGGRARGLAMESPGLGTRFHWWI